ncbi:MAG: carbon-nitrogen hydrolase family protein [Vicinamibacterales bacterium]
MKLCAAQTRPVRGDIGANIAAHKEFIDAAVSSGADLIVFPELSLTGYEPTLAGALATDPADSRFDLFQTISNAGDITIGVGMPTRHADGCCVTMLLFQPGKPRLVYSKRYLHADEEPYFVSGPNVACVNVKDAIVAPAICYEVSVAEHSENASRHGAGIYVASVAKTAAGIEVTLPTLAGIARKHAMTTMMANCVGECDGCQCTGRTSIWNDRGTLMGQLSDRDTGLLIFDTASQELIERRL